MIVEPKQKIFVTCYVDPDLDGFACSIAYAELLNRQGKVASPTIFGDPHVEAEYLMKRFGFKYPDRVQTLKEAEKIILVDASIIDGIDKSIDPEKVIEVIDHRKVNDSALFRNADIQVELIGAAATLVAERFYNAKVDISTESATLLYGAIISNTLNFQSPITSDRDRNMAKWLNSKLDLGEAFAREMFEAKSDLSGDRLSKTIRGDYSQFDIAIGKICIAQLEIVGARQLIDSRKNEIMSELSRITEEHGFKSTFLSIIDLTEKCNYFVTDKKLAQDILSAAFNVRFVDDVAHSPGLLLRKQMIPILKEKYGSIK